MNQAGKELNHNPRHRNAGCTGRHATGVSTLAISPIEVAEGLAISQAVRISYAHPINLDSKNWPNAVLDRGVVIIMTQRKMT